MREGWKCPQCGTVISPDVAEHRCGVRESLPSVPWPYQPLFPEPRICDACRKGGICGCTFSGWPVTSGIGVGTACR